MMKPLTADSLRWHCDRACPDMSRRRRSCCLRVALLCRRADCERAACRGSRPAPDPAATAFRQERRICSRTCVRISGCPVCADPVFLGSGRHRQRCPAFGQWLARTGGCSFDHGDARRRWTAGSGIDRRAQGQRPLFAATQASLARPGTNHRCSPADEKAPGSSRRLARITCRRARPPEHHQSYRADERERGAGK